MTYKELCTKMAKAGWMTHPVFECLKKREGAARRDAIYELSLTYHAWKRGDKLPIFDPDDACVMGHLHMPDGSERIPVSIDRERGLIRNDKPNNGKAAYLEDIKEFVFE